MTLRSRLVRMIAYGAAGSAVLALTGCAAGPQTAGGSTSPPPGVASGATTAPDGAVRIADSLRTPDGLDRTYRLYVPAMVTSTATVPLLVVLHGGGGSAARFEQTSGFDAVADSAGFIVAYPDAAQPVAGGVLSTWNAGDCCGYAARAGVDDVGFVRALIGAVSDRYRIDPRRVYVAGFSNGGMLAYRIACQLAGTVAAIAVQSATLEFSPCQPAQPVSLLHIHGTDDDQVPLAGGHGSASVSEVAFTPPAQAVDVVAAADGCDTTPTVGVDPALMHAQLHTFPGCPPGIAVQLVTITGGTHPWMSTSAQELWSFLAVHPRPSR